MTKKLRCLIRAARSFSKDESGVLVIFSLFLFVIMLLVGGLSVDFLRVEDQRTKMQATLDRAILAAADLDEKRPAKEVVEDYFDRAGLKDYLKDVKVYPDITGRSVTAEASFDLDTFFLRLAGVNSLAVSTNGAAREHIEKSEISLVLDISGSMRFDDRMGDLKPAAKNFVEQVLKPDVADLVSISIIPYAGQTNPGRTMFDYLGGIRRDAVVTTNHFPMISPNISNVVTYFDTNADGKMDRSVTINYFPTSGATNFISNDLDVFFGQLVAFMGTKVSAVSGKTVIGAQIKSTSGTTKYYAVANNTNGETADTKPSGTPTNSTLSFNDFVYKPILSVPSSCIEIGGDEFTSTGLPGKGSYEQVPHFMNWSIDKPTMDWGWCPEDDTAIMYAQSDIATLQTYIESLRMHDGTGTHYGMKYGLALLDPASQPAFAHLNSKGEIPAAFKDRPAAWDDVHTAKYVVLMTDGIITEQVRPTDPDAVINGTKELQNQASSKRKNITTADQNVSSFDASCAAAKANGVVVFTIAYEADSTAAGQMTKCASGSGYFFEASRDNIDEAFSAIAGKINQLRLTQ